MNIIRTRAVELSVIPAIAYKQKLQAGGAGVKIVRLDQDAYALAEIDKRTGEAVPYGKVDEKLFPTEAFDEALDMVLGLPYSARGKIKLNYSDSQADASDEADVDAEEQAVEKISMVDSDEYKSIVERYSDEKGKMNYQLMNKDFIQFASKSSTVSEMVANKQTSDEILNFVISNRAAFISGKKDALNETLTKALIDTLNEIDPRSAFKELSAHIRRMLSK